MRVGTRLVSCRFFAQTNRLELGWLIVGQVREGMYNYETMLVIILGNLNISVVKSKKSENDSAPSWVRTHALVVRRLERRPLTCEIIAMAL